MKPILKSLLVLLLIAGYSLNPIHAQNIEMKWGEGTKTTSNIASQFSLNGVNTNLNLLTVVVVGEDKDYYYAVRTKITDKFAFIATSYLLEKYDMSHKLEQSFVLSLLTPEGKSGTFEYMCEYGGKFVLLFSYYDSKNDMMSLYASSVDKQGKQSAPIMIDQHLKKKIWEGDYSFAQPDDNKGLLVVRLNPPREDENRNLKLLSINENIEKTWEKDVTLASNDPELVINDSLYDANGNAFLLYSYKQNKKDKKLVYGVIAYNSKKDILEDIRIDQCSSNKRNELRIFFRKDQLALIGFHYTEENVITGVFSGTLNKETFRLEHQHIEPFHPDTVKKYFSRKSLIEGGLGFGPPDYDIKEIINKDNGSLQVVAEYKTKGTVGETFQGQLTSHDVYYFLDFMIIQLDSAGKIEWTADLPKYQMGLDGSYRYGGYIIGNENGSIYLLYNDNPENIALNSTKNWRNDKGRAEVMDLDRIHKGALMIASISSNGEVKRELLKTKPGTPNLTVMPYNARKMNDGRIWLLGAEKGKFRPGFMRFQ